MNKSKKECQVLIKRDGKFFTLKEKPEVRADYAKMKREIIISLFKDEHELIEVKLEDFKIQTNEN